MGTGRHSEPAPILSRSGLQHTAGESDPFGQADQPVAALWRRRVGRTVVDDQNQRLLRGACDRYPGRGAGRVAHDVGQSLLHGAEHLRCKHRLLVKVGIELHRCPGGSDPFHQGVQVPNGSGGG